MAPPDATSPRRPSRSTRSRRTRPTRTAAPPRPTQSSSRATVHPGGRDGDRVRPDPRDREHPARRSRSSARSPSEINLALTGTQDAATAMAERPGRVARRPQARRPPGRAVARDRKLEARRAMSDAGATAAGARRDDRAMATARAERAGRAVIRSMRGATSCSSSRRPSLYLDRLLALPAPLQPGICFFEWSQIDQPLHVHRARATTGTSLADPVFWQADGQHRGPDRPRRHASRCVLGTALALFFDLHLRGIVVRPRRAHPAHAAHADRRRADVAGPAQPRLGDGQLGAGRARAAAAALAGRSVARALHARSSSTRGSGRRSSWSSCSRGSRRCRGRRSRPSAVDGAAGWQTLRHVTLPLLAPAIVFAAIFRAIDAFRSFDIVFGLTYGGPGNFTTTMSFYTWENGLHASRATATRRRSPTSWSSSRSIARDAAAALRRACGGRTRRDRAGGSSGRSPTCCWWSSRSSASRRSSSSLILSTKARIDILEVPPTLDFDLDQIVENYPDVLIRPGFLALHLTTRSS